MASYYVRELNVAARTEGAAVNVPGAFVQYDPDTDVLTLNDHQWTAAGNVQGSLETVRWSGGTAVTPLDSLAVPSYTARMVAADDRVYFDSYDPDYQIRQVRIGSGGELSASAPVEVSGAYGNIVGAQGDQVFVSLGYSAIAQYAFGDTGGELVTLMPISGYPSAVRFGAASAYFPLGYYGLVVLPL